MLPSFIIHASHSSPAGISVIWHVVGTFAFMIALLAVAPQHQSASCECRAPAARCLSTGPGFAGAGLGSAPARVAPAPWGSAPAGPCKRADQTDRTEPTPPSRSPASCFPEPPTSPLPLPPQTCSPPSASRMWASAAPPSSSCWACSCRHSRSPGERATAGCRAVANPACSLLVAQSCGLLMLAVTLTG